MCRSDEAADYRNALRLARYRFRRQPITLDELRPLYQISWRIAADGKLGKENEINPATARAARVFNDLFGVSGEVANDCVDLPECNPHNSSVMAQASARQVSHQPPLSKQEQHSHREFTHQNKPADRHCGALPPGAPVGVGGG